MEISVTLPDGSILWFEHLQFEAGRCYLYCLNINRPGLKLIRANPLCQLGERNFFWLDGTEDTTVDGAADFAQRRAEFPQDSGIVILSESAANRAFLYEDGLYITEHDDSILIEDGGVKQLITSHEKEELTVYTVDGGVEKRTIVAADTADRSIVQKNEDETGCLVSGTPEHFAEIQLLHEEPDETGMICFRDYLIHLNYADTGDAHRLFLQVHYCGDRAEVYSRDGKLLDDWFTTGKDWNILLDRFGRPEELVIRIYDSDHPMPCTFTDQVYYDLPVDRGCELREARIVKEYIIPV